MTFAVDSGLTSEVAVEVGAARYQQVDSKDRDSPWIREEVAPDPVTIGTGVLGARTVTVAEGLDLYFVVRPPSRRRRLDHRGSGEHAASPRAGAARTMPVGSSRR